MKKVDRWDRKAATECIRLEESLTIAMNWRISGQKTFVRERAAALRRVDKAAYRRGYAAGIEAEVVASGAGTRPKSPRRDK